MAMTKCVRVRRCFAVLLTLSFLSSTNGAGVNIFNERKEYGYINIQSSKIIRKKVRAQVSTTRRHEGHIQGLSASLLTLRGGDATTQVDTIINALDLVGTSVFAFSGAVTAGRKGMNIMGMWIIASLTAMGGGTLRDVLMDTGTVFWMREVVYLKICTFTVIFSFLLWPTLERRFGWRDSAVPVCTADALGLAAFAVGGTQRAIRFGTLSPVVWVLSGLMTACFGGLLRDVLCFQQPRIMYPSRSLYAAPPLLGAMLYTLLTLNSNVSAQVIATLSFLLTFTLRVISWKNPTWSLPYWKHCYPVPQE